MSPQGFSGMPGPSPGNWYQVQSEVDISTNDLEEGVIGWLMKFTVAVKWWIGRKKAKKLVMLVKWDASYGNACSSFKQKISIWNSFNGIDQSRKHHFQQRPGGDARKKIRRWEAKPAQSELLWKDLRLFGQCSHASHSSWHWATASDLHSASACPACPLPSSSAWKDGSTWAS